jgi:hypothetical protein
MNATAAPRYTVTYTDAGGVEQVAGAGSDNDLVALLQALVQIGAQKITPVVTAA